MAGTHLRIESSLVRKSNTGKSFHATLRPCHSSSIVLTGEWWWPVSHPAFHNEIFSMVKDLENVLTRTVEHHLCRGCDESVRNLSTNLLRCFSGEYIFAFISNQLQKEVWDM
ncbi:hypothetical protein TNCV_1479411 [Trichonephila clavipes]|nr:hypothetical protein TNCV_1479411 [Trichonephila clavipes]